MRRIIAETNKEEKDALSCARETRVPASQVLDFTYLISYFPNDSGIKKLFLLPRLYSLRLYTLYRLAKGEKSKKGDGTKSRKRQ